MSPDLKPLGDLISWTNVLNYNYFSEKPEVVGNQTGSSNPSLPCSDKKIIGYFTSWGNRDINSSQAKHLTHVIFAFIEMKADGSLAVGSVDPKNSDDIQADTEKSKRRLEQLKMVKKQTGGRLRTLFAVGGWENSQYFSATAGNTDKQVVFMRDMKYILNQYDFDGIDIDWEYPVTGGAQEGLPADQPNYVQFLTNIRNRLVEIQKRNRRKEPYLLSIASAAGSWVLDVGYDLKGIISVVDWINVMTYDYFGAWASQWGAYTGPPAPLYYAAPTGFSGKMNADYTLKFYVCNTGRPEKIVMCLPFYGRYWNNVGAAIDPKDGLWRTAVAADVNYYAGGFASWRDIKASWLNRNGYQSMYHGGTATLYLWSESYRTMMCYDNAKSLTEKVRYAADHSLGGVVIWAIDLDDDQDSLLGTVNSAGICTGKSLKYKCNPLGKEKRWWTPEDGQPKKEGMCGRTAPLYKSYYPVCDPDDPGYSCCGQWGYCGSGPASCDCKDCVDYGK